ncbi:hypothetical protein [Thiosocius teredinicola]|uniref:hypothetical protein n=1 Tax=Thiosocius teredinicola TaxID=1973002 RepID=UPI002FE4A672
MEEKHRQRLVSAFPDRCRFARIVVLDIPDDYRFMDPELVEILNDAVAPLVESSR